MKVRESVVEPGDIVLVKNVGLKGKQKLADRWNKQPYVVVDQPIKDIPVFAVKREHGRGRPKLLHRNLLLPFSTIPPLMRRGVSPSSDLEQETSETGASQPDIPPIIEDDSVSEARNGDSGHLNTTQICDNTDNGDSGHQDNTSGTTQLGDNSIGETEHQNNVINTTQSRELKDSIVLPDTPSRQPSQVGPYIIPQMRPDAVKLNPLADPFIPRASIPTRARRPQRDRQKPKWMLSDNWRLK